jgi:hypothetical protein
MVTVAKPKFPYVLNKIRFITLYLILQVRIVLIGSLLATRKNLKNIIPFLLGVLFLTSTNILWAQQPQWPWTFEGENFQITNNDGDNFSPSIASNGDIYLAVWHRTTAASGMDIYGVMINSKGEILGDEIPICTGSNDQMFPVVSSDGENFFVVWQDRRSGKRWDIYGARVTPDGEVLDPDGFPIFIGSSNRDQVSPALSYDGVNYLVVWQGKRTARTWNIYGARISNEGQLFDERPIQIVPSSRDQVSPAVEFDGHDYLIVWQDKRNGNFYDIVGARLTPLGRIRDPGGILLTNDNSGQDRWRPVLSWNGTTYLVVWMVFYEPDEWTLYGKRVGPDGGIKDLVELAIENDGGNKVFPAIHRDGSNYLLVWENQGGGGDSSISGAFVIPFDNNDAFHVSEAVPISMGGAFNNSLPALSGIDNTALVVWHGQDPEGGWQIYGQLLLKPSGVVP